MPTEERKLSLFRTKYPNIQYPNPFRPFPPLKLNTFKGIVYPKTKMQLSFPHPRVAEFLSSVTLYLKGTNMTPS